MSETLVQIVAQAQPWFGNAGVVGALLGSGIGILGGAYGASVGVLAPKGKARRFVVSFSWAFLAIGLVLLAAGVTALATGQPYAVWYTLLLPGALATVLMSIFTPLVRVLYRQAEHRRLEAEEFRRG